MPRTPIGWVLTIGVPVLAVAAALLLIDGGTPGPDVREQAAAVCTDTQRRLEQIPDSPSSVAEGLEIERRMLAILEQEVTELRALAPRAGESFRAGVDDFEALVSAFSSIIARPDFVRLSLTLPGHPERVPGWLKRWQARQQALQADGRARFSEAGIPECEQFFG